MRIVGTSHFICRRAKQYPALTPLVLRLVSPAFWSPGVLVTWRFGQLAFWSVGVLVKLSA